MLLDFEPPTTSTPTKHDAATAKELHTPVKLITFSIVDMATSPFAHHKTSSIARQQQQKQKHKRTTDTEQGNLPYSNLLSKIKQSAQITKTQNKVLR